MFSYPIIPDNSEAQHSSISIYIPSAGRSFMLEFLLWSSKKHLVRCLPNSKVFWSSAVRTSFSRRDCRFRWSWGKISSFSRIMDHDPICWMLGIMMDFFKQPRASVQIKAGGSLNFLKWSDLCRQTLFTFCLCIILTWNPIDYRCLPFYLVVHQRIYCFCISSLCL